MAVEIEAWTPELVAAMRHLPMVGDQVHRGEGLLIVSAKVWREDGGFDLHLTSLDEWSRR